MEKEVKVLGKTFTYKGPSHPALMDLFEYLEYRGAEKSDYPIVEWYRKKKR